MDYLSRIVADSDDREAWLIARTQGITASNAANLTTEKSVDAIIKSKFYDSFMGNPATEWGIEREPILLEYAGFEQNTNLFHAEDNKRFMATPDGIKQDGDKLQLCQVKTTSKKYDKIPLPHYRQVQWEMMVMGAESCLYVWEEHENFVPVDIEPKWLLIDRDEKTIEKLRNLAEVALKRLNKAKAFEEEII